MAQLILVDTDILIDAGRKVIAAIGYLEHMEQQTTLGISVITQMELMVGCCNKRERRLLERFLEGVKLIAWIKNATITYPKPISSSSATSKAKSAYI